MPDTPEGVWFSRFPDAGVVGAAAASLPAAAVSTLLDVLGPVQTARGRSGWESAGGLGIREGVIHRIEVSPGVIAVRRKDYAAAERAVERALAVEWLTRDLRAAGLLLEGATCVSCGHVTCRVIRKDGPMRRGRITAWSSKSRANMVRTLASLDWSALTALGTPAMVTLTYPGDWLAVAPSSATCQGHLRALRKRFARAWGRPLIGVWKREFQRRGAPHYHLLMVPPTGVLPDGRGFREWLSDEWVAVVGHTDPAERERHRAAGTGVDYAEGSRCVDPKRIGVYFSKHGSFAAKDYQNDAPAEWLADEGAGIGRFWGVWGLDRATVTREVDADFAEDVVRTLRRWHRSSRPLTTVPVWRKVTTVDRETGEIGWKWRKRRVTKRVRRMTGRSGFLLVNDAPSLAVDLSRLAQSRPASSFAAWSASQPPAGIQPSPLR